MNDNSFTPIEKGYDYLLSKLFYDRRRVTDYYLRKKLRYILNKPSDYYVSQMIPDFFVKNHLSNHYYPYLTATRIFVSSIFLVLGWRYVRIFLIRFTIKISRKQVISQRSTDLMFSLGDI